MRIVGETRVVAAGPAVTVDLDLGRCRDVAIEDGRQRMTAIGAMEEEGAILETEMVVEGLMIVVEEAILGLVHASDTESYNYSKYLNENNNNGQIYC